MGNEKIMAPEVECDIETQDSQAVFKPINEMSIEELRSELRRTRRQRAELSKKLEAKGALLESYKTSNEDRIASKVVEAVEKLIPFQSLSFRR
jgi:hypothetical protein